MRGGKLQSTLTMLIIANSFLLFYYSFQIIALYDELEAAIKLGTLL